jgi:hypothetical protein
MVLTRAGRVKTGLSLQNAGGNLIGKKQLIFLICMLLLNGTYKGGAFHGI